MKTALSDIIDTIVIFATSLFIVIAGVAGVIKAYDVFSLALVSALCLVVFWGIGSMIIDDIRRNKRIK